MTGSPEGDSSQAAEAWPAPAVTGQRQQGSQGRAQLPGVNLVALAHALATLGSARCSFRFSMGPLPARGVVVVVEVEAGAVGRQVTAPRRALLA